MNTSSFSLSIFLFLHLLLLPLHIAFANDATSSAYVSSNDAETNKSLMAKASVINASVPDVPYMTARVFHSPFAYRFNVTPGSKFVRLHFYPTSYSGLDVSKGFVSVTASNFTLMHNLSVSLTADYLNKVYLMKEFIIHVSGRTLELTFSPSSNASDIYAFVNGIEVVSMPSNLYIQGGHAHIPLVGHDQGLYYIYNDSALETMYRINTGGYAIPAKYDTGMFRTWTGDEEASYSPIAGYYPDNMIMPIRYPKAIPPYVAPELVYRTSTEMPPFPNPFINLNFNLSWLFSVDSGFHHLVRLHICDVSPDRITKTNQVVFNIYLNNQTAMDRFDIIAVSGGPGIPVYLDFVVMVPETSEGKQDLSVDLYPDVRSKPQYITAFLNGVEIFKLSNWDGNLAGDNPISSKSESVVPVPHVAVSKSQRKSHSSLHVD
ncbi:hypothetical protein K1719_017645 [Acacia pycnantha]|nr:hypothetical protein K1719_017645 [Acacia pycnantha]